MINFRKRRLEITDIRMIYMACLRILGPRQLQEDVDDNGDMVAVRPSSREALADLWKANESKLDREIRDRFCLMP